MLGSSISVRPASGESAGSWNFRSSTLPPKKVSVLIADGVRSVRAISVAQISSGLTDRLRPRSSEIRDNSSAYSGFRTRAMVCFAPIFLAIRQHSRFSSSCAVTAITSSASSTPASICVAYVAPFPSMLRISRSSTVRCSGVSLRSTMVISCPSRESCSASALPIFPSPTITIRIISTPFLCIRSKFVKNIVPRCLPFCNQPLLKPPFRNVPSCPAREKAVY